MSPVFNKVDGRVIHFVGVQVPILLKRRRSGCGFEKNGVSLCEDGSGFRENVFGSCRREVCSDSVVELARVLATDSVLGSDDRELEVDEPCEASDLEKRKAATAIDNILSVLTHYSEVTGRLVCGKRCCLPGMGLLGSSLNISLGRIKQSFVLTDPHLPDMPIVYASDAFLTLTGYDRHEVVGRNCRFLSGMDTDSSTIFQIRESIQNEQPCTVRILNYRKDKSSFWNFLHISPVRNASGKIAYFVGVQIDESCKHQDKQGLGPELRQRSVVGAVRVAVRSLSMGVGTSNSRLKAELTRIAASNSPFNPIVQSPEIFNVWPTKAPQPSPRFDAGWVTFPPNEAERTTTTFGQNIPGGEWVLLQNSIGVSAMHMQLLYNNKVVIFDRTDFGTSNLTLPHGECRYNDHAVKVDCSAHSLVYDVATNTYRPLMVQTNVWCSSGAVHPDGTLIQTGGYLSGDRKIRLFKPCNDVQECDWIELPQNLTVRRWYATNQILPDGRVIIVGGRRQFSYEFFPKNPNNASSKELYQLPFLRETTDKYEENNLYPFLYILPDGNLYIFANQRSISFDYVNNRIVQEFPPIPGEKRNYPATGSSVLLPLRLTDGNGSPEVEVLICGGAAGGSYYQAEKTRVFVEASKTCGRLKLTDPVPQWVMEEMPMGRVMPDMIMLPTGDVLIINGASRGTAGWDDADGPVLYPVLYMPNEPNSSQRFTVLNPTIIPRMYHSAAILLPDGRILVGGSNPHKTYNFTAVPYPTELSLEAFSPHYMDPQYADLRPSIISMEARDMMVSYGEQFALTFGVNAYRPDLGITVALIAPSFSTHSFGMNQRLIVLDILHVEQLSRFAYKVNVYAPPTPNIAPPGYYMVFVVHDGIPGHCVWIKII
ncbi:hypothetical protein F0562_033730 [Nyssa sinensis]|uniref:PAS domain-containing protein n=1 Tax=Nyssa sinensis TaxID=561372 RepID=A0A5J5AK17_9ASTE|nr:hypothetical protein F0562_033730 [Nyssa sinensis]